jgi:uncharacterized protein (DUF4415 family)
MTKKPVKSVTGSLFRMSLKKAPWQDPDDAPEITDAMLDRAEIVKDGKIVRRGRPPLGDKPKNAVTLRLDADVLASYRALGAGWQSRINADLRRVRKLKARAS